jgi:hypothetical protein
MEGIGRAFFLYVLDSWEPEVVHGGPEMYSWDFSVDILYVFPRNPFVSSFLYCISVFNSKMLKKILYPRQRKWPEIGEIHV